MASRDRPPVINTRPAAHGPERTDKDQETTSLLERCKLGQETAWKELFAQRAAQIYRWAVFLGLSPSEAEDAAQDVLATAARRIRSCRAPEALSSWLYQITRRVVANHRRRQWIKRLLFFADTQDPAFRHATEEDQEQELMVRRCLQRLSPAHAEVLLLMDFEGFTREEAAELLGVPAGTVASRLRLARSAFRKHWQGEGEIISQLSWRKS